MRALFALCMLYGTSVFSIIRVLTFQHNQPDFIGLQDKCLKKFMLEEYELIVFNDAKTKELEDSIQQACDSCGVRHVRFQQQWHRGHLCSSVRHSQVIQYAMDKYGYDHDDIVVILDGDAFPVRPLDIRGMLSNFDVIATGRNNMVGTSVLLWVPFVAFNPQRLPNIRNLYFHPTMINGYMEDTGAASYFYFQENPSVTCKTVLSEFMWQLNEHPAFILHQKGFNDSEISLIRESTRRGGGGLAFEMNGTILHFRETWLEDKEHQVRQEVKREHLYYFLNQVL